MAGSKDQLASEGQFIGGSGPRLLLLHSGFQTWREWRGLIPLLIGEREVLAPTLPGSAGGTPLGADGRSFLEAVADDVEARLDAAGWTEPVTILGSSHGGIAALELAARGRASEVIALAPPWVGSVANAAAWAAVFLPAQAATRLTRRLHPRLTRSPAFGGLYFNSSRLPVSAEPDDVLDCVGSFDRFPIWQMMRNDGPGGRRMPDLDAVTCPVLLIHGTRDRLVPGWMHRRWTALLPEAETLTLEGFPHCPHLRDPERIAEIVLSRSTPSRSGGRGARA